MTPVQQHKQEFPTPITDELKARLICADLSIEGQFNALAAGMGKLETDLTEARIALGAANACIGAHQADRAALIAALDRIVLFETCDPNDDAVCEMAEDAAVRGLTSAQYRRELIEEARATLAKVQS